MNTDERRAGTLILVGVAIMFAAAAALVGGCGSVNALTVDAGDAGGVGGSDVGGRGGASGNSGAGGLPAGGRGGAELGGRGGAAAGAGGSSGAAGQAGAGAGSGGAGVIDCATKDVSPDGWCYGTRADGLPCAWCSISRGGSTVYEKDCRGQATIGADPKLSQIYCFPDSAFGGNQACTYFCHD